MEYFIELLKYVVLGIVQGVTEIFPVSSSGHIVLFSKLMMGGQNLSTDLKLFLMITNMGSFLALLLYYFNDVKLLIRDSWIYIFNKDERHDTDIKYNFEYSLKLLISVIPVGISGLLINHYIEPTSFFTGISLLVTSALLAFVFFLRNKQFANDITYQNALVIGLFQALSPFPGISRSGITIVGGLSQKISLPKVLRFSFLSYLVVSIPVSILGLYEAVNNPGVIDLLGYTIAFVFSFIFSYLTVQVLNKYVKVNNLIWFSIYTFIIGIILLFI